MNPRERHAATVSRSIVAPVQPALIDNVAQASTAVPTVETPARGTILLVSAAFPPWTVVGAARWEGFAPHLNAAGWELSVLTEAPPSDAHVDHARVNKLGPHVRVQLVPRRSPAWRETVLRIAARVRNRRTEDTASGAAYRTEVHDSLSAVSLRTFHPREFFGAAVEASRARKWIRDIVARSATLDDMRQATMVISSGPPHDAHVAAAEIARQRGLPHVVDLRDPWIGNNANAGLGWSLLRGPLGAAAERRVLLAAAAVITNTPSAAAALIARHPELAGRVHAVMNGSDAPPQPPRVLPAGAPYLIVHTGTLYLDRDPRPFLRAIAKVRAQNPTAAERMRVVFMGHPAVISGRSLADWAREFGLGEAFEERPFGTRAEAAALMDSAAMLVAFQGATPTQVPAKVFEYVSNAAALLALTDIPSATAAVLEGSSARVAPIDDETLIASHIEEAFNLAVAGVPTTPVNADGRYARANQARLLFEILTKL